MVEPVIDPEFRSYIRPLNKFERSQLTKNIIKEGCKEPITLWNNIIIDGHHRYEICSTLHFAYKTQVKEFKDRTEVLNWIIENQTGRRNLSTEESAYYRGKLYENTKKEQGGERGNQYTIKHSKTLARVPNVPLPELSNVHKNRTAETLSRQFKVSTKTIKEDVKYAKSVDMIAQVMGPEYRAKMLFDKILSKKDTILLSKEAPTKQKQIFTKIRKINTSSKKDNKLSKRIQIKKVLDDSLGITSVVEIVVAEVKCPECGTNHYLIHGSKNKHRLRKI